MLLNIKDIDIYYLNTNDRVDRREHMEKILGMFDLNFERIEAVPDSSKLKSIASSCAKTIITALTKHKSFKPFIILEDDVDWYIPAQEEDSDKQYIEVDVDDFLKIEYPHDADAIYLGLSDSSCDPVKCRDKPGTKREDVLKTRHTKYSNLFRIYNMLSGHAVLYLSHRYALAYLMSMMEAVYLDTWCDTIACRIFPQFNVYALAKPLFYQSNEFGGQEDPTCINWINDEDTTKLTGTEVNCHEFKTYTGKIYKEIIRNNI